MSHHSPTPYRPDVDGLRAIAVIAVILFHAGVPAFAGGFVGVDVFLVISGFLITGIIARQLADGSFSFVDFWYRRVKRIVPAAVAVMGAVYAAAFFLLRYPADFTNFLQSLFAQSLFASNIFFLRVDSYFGSPLSTYPLLHTWSLAIEEQFYLVVPIVLFAAYMAWSRRGLIVAVVLTGLLSLAYDIYLVNIAPDARFALPLIPDIWHASNATAGFFLLPARAWELMIGAFLAVSAWSLRSRMWSEVAGWGGLTAIVYAACVYTPETAFPGLAALLPTMGAAAVILGGNSSAARMLSRRPFVGVGLISYSLYLWHWPLIVFAGVMFAGSFSVWHALAAAGIALPFAYLTYRYVETPFRMNTLGVSRHRMIAYGVAALALLAAVALLSLRIDMRARVPEAAQAIIAATEDISPLEETCETESIRNGYCTFGVDGEASVLVWGDSHARVLLPLLDRLAMESDVSGALVTTSGCMPRIEDVDTISACADANRAVWRLLDVMPITHVVLAARWSSYPTSEERSAVSELATELESRDISTTVVQEVPPQPAFVPRTMFYQALFSGIDPVADIAVQQQGHEPIGSTDGRVQYLNPASLLCLDGMCRLQDGGILYRDDNHLNLTGVQLLEPLFIPLFE